MGLFKKDPPPPPDFSPIANASAASSAQAFKLGEDQLAWAKEQYAQDRATTNQVVQADLEAQRQNQANAQADRARYQQTFQPLEDQLAKEAQDYASPERKQLEMGRAQATVSQQFDASRANAQRDLEAFGVNPASTRFAALDIGTRTQQAAAGAGAGNQASQMVDATGRALRSEAINVGRGYPGQIAGTYNTALAAGSGAVNSNLATTASGANTMGTAPQYMGIGQSALGVWGNTLNTGYQNQLAYTKGVNSMSSGLGALAGAAAGFGSKAFFASGGAVPELPGVGSGSDSPQRQDYKNDKPYSDQHFYVIPAIDPSGRRMAPDKAMKHFFHTGLHHGVYTNPADAHQAAQQPDYHMQLRRGYAYGGMAYADGGETPPGPVPTSASPSGGSAVDDVPANLTSGEFIIPKDVTQWKGEEFFQKMIEQSRKAKQGAVAKPTTGAVPTGAPNQTQAVPA